MLKRRYTRIRNDLMTWKDAEIHWNMLIHNKNNNLFKNVWILIFFLCD